VATATTRAAQTPGAATYLLDETSGETVLDASDPASNGRLGAPGPDNAEPARVAGVVGGALQFDGTNDYVSVADAPELGFAGSFTLEAWVQRPGTSTTDAVLAKEGGGRNYRVRILPAGQVELGWKDTSGATHSTAGNLSIADGGWHHVACVHDQSVGEDRIYVDGGLDRSRADAAAPAPCTDPLVLGARGTSKKDFLHGSLDLVRLSGDAIYTQSFEPPAGFAAKAPVPIVRVTWSPGTGGSTPAGYRLYRSTNAEPFAPLTPNPVQGTSFADETPVDGVLAYRVTAVDALGQESAPSMETSLRYGRGPTGPQPPPGIATRVERAYEPPAGNAVFSFDEGSGSTCSEVLKHALQANLGSATWGDASEPTWVPGVAGSALRFDGANDYVDAPDDPALRFGTSFTLEAWIQRQATGVYAVLFSKESSSVRNYRLALQASGALELSWKDATSGQTRLVQSGVTVPAGEWHHVAAVFDAAAAESRLYLDGQPVGHAPTPGAPQTGSQRMRLGARISSASTRDPFAGALDLVRLTNSALYRDIFTPPASYDGRTVKKYHVFWRDALPGSARVAGYNVYRETPDGGWGRVNEQLCAGLELVLTDPPTGSICYRASSVDRLGLESELSEQRCLDEKPPVLLNDKPAPAASGLRLQVGPNPFNPATRVAFHLDGPARVEARVYDVAGREVRTLANGVLPAGEHRLDWNGRDARGGAVASGVYFLRFRALGEVRQLKLVMTK
jgi:hypothetical protein